VVRVNRSLQHSLQCEKELYFVSHRNSSLEEFTTFFTFV